MTTPERSVEEIVEEGKKLVEKYIDDVGRLLQGQPSQVKNAEFTKWLTQTLQAERQKREEGVEAVRAEYEEDEIKPLDFCDDCEHLDCRIARDFNDALSRGLIANKLIQPNKK